MALIDSSCFSRQTQLDEAPLVQPSHLSQDTLIDAANVVPFTMALPMVAMVKAGSSGLMLGFR